MPLTDRSSKPIEIFYSYSHRDEKLRNKLETHLSLLKQQGLVINWHDRKISAGREWEKEINTFLDTAHIILLLISPDFLASKYCYSVEMKHALEQHERGEAHVIPIILRRVYWQGALFGKLQALPTDAKPVTGPNWHNQDEAFFDVAEGIRKVVKEILSVQMQSKDMNYYSEKQDSEETFASIEQTIKLNPREASDYIRKGKALANLFRYEEALSFIEKAIELNPSDAANYTFKGNILYDLKHYKKALKAYEQAISLNPNNPDCYKVKAMLLLTKFGSYKEALEIYEQAIHLNPNDAHSYQGKGQALTELKRYKEALAAYEQAIRLDPTDASFYRDKGQALTKLERYDDALAANSKAALIDGRVEPRTSYPGKE